MADPADDIFTALNGFAPLATDKDVQDWINTYSSEVWFSQDEKFGTITGDATVRCSVSPIFSMAPHSESQLTGTPRLLLQMLRNPLELGPTDGSPLSLVALSLSIPLRTGISSLESTLGAKFHWHLRDSTLTVFDQ